jgi:phage terminase large subunit GpA-like protein
MQADFGPPEIVINDQYFKKLLYHYLNVESVNEKAYIHFPANFSEKYFAGLTSEIMVEETDKRTGKKRSKITNTKGKRNEPLDLMKMAYAILYYMCGEHYGTINRRLRAAKKQEMTVDVSAFIRMMDDSTRTQEGGE